MKTCDIQEKVSHDDKGNLHRVSNVLYPRLVVFRPVKPCGTAVIICPDGGYKSLNIENARFIAQRLNTEGITAFVLVYRLPSGQMMTNLSIAGLQDVREAFRLVRRQADKWKLLLDKIGLWGSSAGGHLAAMAATHYNTVFEEGKSIDGLRPDFLVLAWPVVSFCSEYTHKGSMRNLLGENPGMEQKFFFSPERHVTHNTPPTFLVHADNDTSVSANNSIMFYQALKEAGVPAELHIYGKGGHGFGIVPDVRDSWMNRLFVWMCQQNFIQ
jgi:acetyl esterase/lipase